METNTRTQTNASNQLSTEGKLPLKWALDDLEYQVEILAHNLVTMMTFGRPSNENTHGQTMYTMGVRKMAKEVIEMLKREVE